MDKAALICARLLREGTMKRSELPDLSLPEIRAEVERRLASVGLVLATSAYSEHVGLRLSPDVTAESSFDAASNLGLGADACALLVVLWAKLVLQKRTAADTRAIPGQAALLPEDQAAAARAFTPSLRYETLYREFGKIIGSRSHIRRLVGRLRTLGFIETIRGQKIVAGPLLELGIDGEKMVAFIRRGVLKDLLEKPAGKEEEPEDGADAQVLNALRKLGGEASKKELAEAMGEKPERVLSILRELVQSGRVRRTGERSRTRYRLVEG